MHPPSTGSGRGVAVKIAMIYALFSGGYILFSDRILLFFISDSQILTQVQTFKGVAFVMITAVLIFAMIDRAVLGQQSIRNQLVSSEEKYRVVVDNSPDLIYRTDLSGRIIFISPSVFPLSGYSVSEALGMDLAAQVYVDPDDRRIFLERLGRDGYIRDFEVLLKKKDGSTWWASTNAHFYHDSDGTVMGVEGVTRDVTLKKMSEQALLASEQQLRAIYDANPDPMVLYDLNGHPLRINPAFTKVFGWMFHELEGRKIPFVPEGEKALTGRKIREIFDTGIPLAFETKRLTRDGQPLDVLLSAAVIKDETDRPYGMVVNMTDISHNKVLEAQYEQAQRMDSLGTLAGGIAHDFNNFLTGILGYMDLARKAAANVKVETYLKKALAATDRARSLTHQLLTFSKGGAPVKEEAPLEDLLRETTQFALSGANVSCEFSIPEGLWTCEYDRNQICQVIDNIVINAHHAMPGGGCIRVRAENIHGQLPAATGLPPGQYVRVSIEDNGTGIPAKYLQRIFDPFFSTKQEGSGLGLATSYSIVKRHGGAITVDSEPGAGSRFDIYLPATGESGREGEKEAEPDFKGKGTILIMDDEVLIREMLALMLEDMGFDTVAAHDGQEAVAIFSQRGDMDPPLRAVILDLTVPGGMGGKEAGRQIRQMAPDLPLFVASGYSDDDALASPEAFGFTASLEKPFLSGNLAAMLRQHLRPESGAHGSSVPGSATPG